MNNYRITRHIEKQIDRRIMIKRIFFENLFGNINSDIYLDTSYPVSILSAPNGCGKTTTFKFLKFLFDPSVEMFKNICEIPFDRFSCELSNGTGVSIIKEKKKALVGVNRIAKWANKFTKFILKDADELRVEITSLGVVKKAVGFCDYFSQKGFERAFLQYDDRIERRSVEFVLQSFILEIKSELEKYHCCLNIDFIEANRLQKIYPSLEEKSSISLSEFEYSRGRKSKFEKVDYLVYANDEIREKIGNCLKEYNRKLAEAKNKLPLVYINASDDNDEDYASFKKRWDRYHQELDKFHRIGIIDSDDTIRETDLKTAYKKKSAFLKTYLDVFESTLEPLQENYEKMRLFIDIFNKRNEITGKTVKFTQSGVEIYFNSKKIDIDSLSSGEKNDFVMFYWLIFDTSKNGVVLIDEPEISLHIEWQEEYIDRLIDVCKMNRLQAIVATHSPNIVNGHFELFVDKR